MRRKEWDLPWPPTPGRTGYELLLPYLPGTPSDHRLMPYRYGGPQPIVQLLGATASGQGAMPPGARAFVPIPAAQDQLRNSIADGAEDLAEDQYGHVPKYLQERIDQFR